MNKMDNRISRVRLSNVEVDVRLTLAEVSRFKALFDVLVDFTEADDAEAQKVRASYGIYADTVAELAYIIGQVDVAMFTEMDAELHLVKKRRG
jgi:hypothetical protein